MNLVINYKYEVYFDDIKIGSIGYRGDKKCFMSHATYEKHIYRKLNSWTVNAEVINIPDLQFIMWNVSGKKMFGISVSKLKKFMKKYNAILSGFKGYKKFEYQIAIPVSLCDSHIYGNTDINRGVSLEEFENMTNDPHTAYHEWVIRKEGNRRHWSLE